MNWLALDIGGAHLKAADGLGYAASRFFPLWRQPEHLPHALARLVAEAPAAEALAVTMTGELADCFTTKAEGVTEILEAVASAAAGRPVAVYLTDGTFAKAERACAEPLLAAAANWHALARFAGRYVPGRCGLVVDIGSTTTDIIPLKGGQPAARGCTDPERLVSGELVYSGVIRSPICALVSRVPWRGKSCEVAQELFATTRDAWLMLGELAEEPDDIATADGRPATCEAAYDRLARSICADRSLLTRDEAKAIAQAVAEAQCRMVAAALEAVLGSMPKGPEGIVLAGRGEFLARRALARLTPNYPLISLGERLGEKLSQVATAHALAVLARDEL